MPFHYDWENEINARELELPSVNGWGDTTIQYCYATQENGLRVIVWRIKDIDHSFIETNKEFLKYENPGQYFRENLKAFRTQLIGWARDIKAGNGEPWMGEYITMFKDHVK